MMVGMADDVAGEYAKALDKADTLDELRSVTKRYGEVAADAVMIAESMTQEEFEDWRHAVKKERRGKFMGEQYIERFGPLLMPEIIFKVQMVASEYKVPWGLAYKRLKEVGRLKIKNEIATLDLKER